jgi:signal transduction histidine kinase
MCPAPWTTWLRSESHPAFLAFQVLGPLLQFIAVLSWPALRPSGALRWREVLDGMIFTSSLFLVFWLLGLGDLEASAAIPARVKGLQLVFFLDYTLLVGVTLYRGLDAPGRFRGPLGWILAAFLLIALGNVSWIELFLRGAYHPGHPLNGTGLFIQTLFLLAALAPSPPDRGASWEGRAGYLFEPYLPIFVVLPLGVRHLLRHPQGVGAVTLWLALGMAFVVLVRQLVALADMRRFVNSLEATVQKRTGALEELQALMIRNQRMNLLATLGAGLAHDLNNLLSVVKLTSTLLQEDVDEGRPPQGRDLARLQAAADQASGIATNLMAYGRQGEVHAQLFELNEKVRGMANLLEKLAGKDVKVAWSLVDAPMLLELDPMHVEQILVNLVVNARDAMPGGGSLELRTGLLPTGHALLEVKDTGTGILPEHLPRLFEAFFTTKEPGKGTGLGLASVKAIAEECGGVICVASDVGQGTTFTLRLPLAGLP